MGKWNNTHGLDPELVARLIREHRDRPEPPLAWLGPFGEVRYNYSRIARELFPVEPLPESSLAIYDHNPDLVSDLVAEDDPSE